MTRLNTFGGIIFTLALSSILSQAQPLISRELIAEIQSAPANEALPVVFVLQTQVKFEEIYPQVKDLPKPERRLEVIAELHSLAKKTQGPLLNDLRIMERGGLASDIRPLWITNVIAARIRADEILPLVKIHPEIDRVRWDPPRLPGQVADRMKSIRIQDQIADVSWGVVDINATQVWDIGYRGQGILIANLDLGVDYTHPDLADHIWVNPGEDINGNGIVDSSDWNGIDDDLNGYVDDLRGWAFGANSPEVMDEDGHGTATAGVVLGDGTGGSVTGVAPEATMMILKNYAGGESQYWEAQQYAIMMGADVITSSVSYKWRFHPKPDYATMRQNTRMELAAGLIHANSIGNEGDNLNTDPIPFNVATPGNCPPPWLHPDQTLIGRISSTLGVGAYDAGYTLKDYSSVGPSAWNLDDILFLDPEYPYQASWPVSFDDYPYENGRFQALLKPDLAAPTGVTTTALGGGYLSGFIGTSAATPHLGGTLCLLLSAVPDATPELLAEAVMSTAVDMGEPGKDNFWGCGRLDAYAAVAFLLLQSHATLTGLITDAYSGNPVGGATIALPEVTMQAQSDSSGYYLLPGIPEGTYDVRFTASGYDTLWVPDVTLSVGVVETLSVALESPRIWVEPDNISVMLDQGESLLVPVIVHNAGTSNLSVEFTKQGDWDPYQVYSIIDAQTAAGDDQLFGAEVAVGSLWVSGGNAGLEPNKLYRFSLEGELLEMLDQPPSASSLGWRDLAWDGQYLYGSSGSLIEGVDLTGSVQTIINGPLELHRALAYNPDGDLFYSCDGTTNIVEFNRDGVVLRSWGHDLHIQGLAWHPEDEDGYPLYIFSADGESVGLRMSKMNPDAGEIIFLTDLSGITGDQAGGAAITPDIDPDRWCFVGLIRGGPTAPDRVQIYSLGAYAPWLSVEPPGGDIDPGGTLDAQATLDAGVVPPGEYDINLVVLHNAPQDDIVIPVSLTVTPVAVKPSPPSALIPSQFAVLPAYPNPFNPTTNISFQLPEAGFVKLEIFDLNGRNVGANPRVCPVVGFGESDLRWYPPGMHQIIFDGSNLPSGIYIYRLQTGDLTASGKMILLK